MSPAIELASALERNQRPGRLSMEPIMETRQEQSTRGPVRNGVPITICRVPPPLEPLPKTGRRKLWNIPHKYHCPVIGTCLGVDELRRIASRLVLRGDAPTTDYDIHVTFVGAADTKNAISLATHKALERKYQSVVMRFARVREPDALYILWSEFLARGEVPGAFWALMTHPKADPSLLNQAYEEVHMLSHQVGAGQRYQALLPVTLPTGGHRPQLRIGLALVGEPLADGHLCSFWMGSRAGRAARPVASARARGCARRSAVPDRPRSPVLEPRSAPLPRLDG